MKAIRRAIIICWAMLIVCFIIKLFGGNWFEIMCNNEHFISICNYIDAHLLLKYIIAFVLYVPSTYVLMLSCCMLKNPNKKQVATISLFVISVWASQFISMLTKTILELIMFLILPFITKLIALGKREWKVALKKSWFLGIIGYALGLIFQVISLTTRNIGIKIVDDNTLTTLILMIDYYIMMIIYYLYTRLKLKKE